jgi:hypothetical protein
VGHIGQAVKSTTGPLVNGTTDLAYTCCCEQTPSTCYDDPQYREGTLTGMNCQQWSLTDTNNDYFADCSMADALYVTPTGPSSCAGHSDESGHPTTDQMANSYACEVGGYGPLTNKTRAAHHPDHAQSRASTCPGEGADDDAFRLRGFSCAQWGVKRPNGIVECMPSEDAHWMASDEAYTQAELDSLRTNCPATCVNDVAGTFTTQYAGVATTQTCAAWAADGTGGTAAGTADGVADCLDTQDQKRIDAAAAGAKPSYGELDAIRKACPVICGVCAKKHFYYPASLMNEVRLHCPKACGMLPTECSGTPFG